MDLSQASDEELVWIFHTQPELQRGRAAFEVLWVRYRGSAAAMVHRRWVLIPRGYDPEQFFRDVISRVEYKLIRHLSSGQEVESFRGLLERIVESAALEERRAVTRRLMREVPFDPRPGAEEEAPLEERVEAILFRSQLYDLSTQRILEARERCDIVWTALTILAAESDQGLKESRAMKEFYILGRTQEEIARRFRCSVRTVNRWLTGGRIDLKRILNTRFRIERIEDIL